MTATVYTTSGQQFTADLFNGGTEAGAWYIAWGTGGSSTGGTATEGDSALQAEATEARVTATVEDQPTATQNRFIGRLTAEATKDIEEAGLFTTSTGGIMIIRGSHAGASLATDDIIEYTFTLTHSNG